MIGILSSKNIYRAVDHWRQAALLVSGELMSVNVSWRHQLSVHAVKHGSHNANTALLLIRPDHPQCPARPHARACYYVVRHYLPLSFAASVTR